jgi:WD40 repeat protein
VGALLLLVGLGGVGAETYRLAWSYQTGNTVWSVSISSDGSYVAAGSADYRVYLFSRSSGTPLWSYQTGGAVSSVSTSPDGNYIAAGSGDGKVYLFSRSSGTPLWSYQTGGKVDSVSISSDGSYIAAGGGYDMVYLFSRSSGTPLWSYQTGGIVSVSISPDGSYIAAGSYDGKVYLFSRDSSTPLWSYWTGGGVWSVSISSDGSYIAAATYDPDSRVYLFSRSSGLLWSYQTGGTVSSVSTSPDGNYIAAGSYDGKVYLFSRSSGTPLWSYQTGGAVSSVSISPDGSYIAAEGGYGKVYLFSRDSSTPLWSYWTGGGVWSVSISSDGSYIAAGSHDGKVHLFSKNHLQPTSLSILPSSFTLLPGEHQTLTATLTAGGTPLPGRAVSWSATAGSVSPSSGLTDSSGRVTVVYTAPDTPTTATIAASFAGDAEYGSSYGLSSATVRFESVLVFTKPDGTPLAYTEIYYGTSEGQETALLGTTDGAGRITLTDSALRGTTVYFRSGDGRYRGSVYIPSEGGALSVQLTGAQGRGLLPLILILAVIGGVAVAGMVAWRRGLLRRPARAKPPSEPTGSFCPHCKLKLPPDAQFCPECGKKVK